MKSLIYLNVCGALAACLIGLSWNAARAQSGGTPDIVGIKFGMTIREAMLALKADNPRLSLVPTTMKLEGFTNDLMPYVIGTEAQKAGPPPGYTIASAGEKVTIAFTLTPNQEAVWGVQRVYNFATAERPALQVTLDALRKKYGTESTRLNSGPNANHLTWVYDSQGKGTGPQGAQLDKTCSIQVLNNIQGNPANDIQNGPHWPPECNSTMIVQASVDATQDPASSQYVVTNLTVIMADAGRYKTGMDATRAVVLGAAKSREKQQTDEVNKRAAPKL